MIAFGKSASQRLKESADDFIDMSLDAKKFLLGPSRFAGIPFIGSADEGEKGQDDIAPKVVGSDTDDR